MFSRSLIQRINLVAGLLGLPVGARAAVYNADPSNYHTLLAGLQPGDTLRLAPGNYVRLTIDGLNGTSSAWITITGPDSGPPAVIQGETCCNTVQLYGSSYVAIKSLTIDGLGYDVDGVNAKGTTSHDILIEGCTLINLGNNQQTVGISTKVAVWNWTIRRNLIDAAGTGIYLGGSSGDAPFIAGVIEGNLVRYPTGYCMEIKYQLPYTLVPGMPSGPNRTIIRNNVFIKDDRPSPDGDRPNLLVDGFPDTGPGSSDLYEIYGNFLYHNPRESLFQGSGRMSIHDNLFVDADPSQTAMYLMDHDLPLKLAHVYNNTVYGGAQGIRFGSQPRQEGRAVGNLGFAGSPLSECSGCTLVQDEGNVGDAVSNAARYVTHPSTVLGGMDFYPLTACVPCSGAALNLAAFTGQDDYALDFNGTSKGTFLYRGAYAGAGTNPGWAPSNNFKIGGPSSGGTGAADSVPPSAITDLRIR